jgi:hypothetical protein
MVDTECHASVPRRATCYRTGLGEREQRKKAKPAQRQQILQ